MFWIIHSGIFFSGFGHRILGDVCQLMMVALHGFFPVLTVLTLLTEPAILAFFGSARSVNPLAFRILKQYFVGLDIPPPRN